MTSYSCYLEHAPEITTALLFDLPTERLTLVELDEFGVNSRRLRLGAPAEDVDQGALVGP